jgi:hypothetical protein
VLRKTTPLNPAQEAEMTLEQDQMRQRIFEHAKERARDDERVEVTLELHPSQPAWVCRVRWIGSDGVVHEEIEPAGALDGLEIAVMSQINGHRPTKPD